MGGINLLITLLIEINRPQDKPLIETTQKLTYKKQSTTETTTKFKYERLTIQKGLSFLAGSLRFFVRSDKEKG